MPGVWRCEGFPEEVTWFKRVSKIKMLLPSLLGGYVVTPGRGNAGTEAGGREKEGCFR